MTYREAKLRSFYLERLQEILETRTMSLRNTLGLITLTLLHFECIFGNFTSHNFYQSYFPDEAIPGPYLAAYSDVSQLTCGMQCLADDNCSSFNYHAVEKLCQISERLFNPCSDNVTLEIISGFSHFSKLAPMPTGK